MYYLSIHAEFWQILEIYKLVFTVSKTLHKAISNCQKIEIDKST